jgi:hypothetical protein
VYHCFAWHGPPTAGAPAVAPPPTPQEPPAQAYPDMASTVAGCMQFTFLVQQAALGHALAGTPRKPQPCLKQQPACLRVHPHACMLCVQAHASARACTQSTQPCGCMGRQSRAAASCRAGGQQQEVCPLVPPWCRMCSGVDALKCEGSGQASRNVRGQVQQSPGSMVLPCACWEGGMRSGAASNETSAMRSSERTLEAWQ